ncbi:hypothetical protein AB9A10_32300, partial [Pseudomonas aeruginosa]|uniref:hypothetical protein n=5 Tax=Pseudomonas aeruginosa TaxID=287 RepID=UPI00350F0609
DFTGWPSNEGQTGSQTRETAMSQISIVGYESDCNCEHCGRALRHGIRLSDGRLVGATCLDKKLTKPRKYQGKSFRFGAEHIIKIAKVVQFYSPGNWARFGVSASSATFEEAQCNR